MARIGVEGHDCVILRNLHPAIRAAPRPIEGHLHGQTNTRDRAPEGEGLRTSQAEVDLIRPDVLPMIERYLRERQQHVEEAGHEKALALFPNLYMGRDAFYSANSFKAIKKEVEEASGVNFKLKDFRSTLTSITVYGDMSLPAMSAQLRHSNLATTQHSYYWMQQGVAGKHLRESYKISGSINAQKPVIEKNWTCLAMGDGGPGGIRTPVIGFEGRKDNPDYPTSPW
jgi:hypothetical protein